MRIGFQVSNRCNAACLHCTTNSGPDRDTTLPEKKIRDLMDEAAGIWREERLPGESLDFSISGGEPFLDFPSLRRIVEHGSRLGGNVVCVTNAYWASSDEKAREKLVSLKRAGLSMLAVSTSRFHQRFVPRERVQRALDLARELGIRVDLKCAVTVDDTSGARGLERWARTRSVQQLEVFPVMPYLRDGAQLPEGQYIRGLPLPEGRCPAPMLTVREDGTAYTCCMPGAFTGFHALGNVFGTSLSRIRDRFHVQGKQQVLRHEGPAHFARAVIAAGRGERLRPSYEGVCDLCAHLASDPEMSAIAERAANRFARSRLLATLGALAFRKLSSMAAPFFRRAGSPATEV